MVARSPSSSRSLYTTTSEYAAAAPGLAASFWGEMWGVIRKKWTRRPHLDVLLSLQDVEDSLQTVLLGDLVEGVGHGGVELDEVGQGAVP